PARPAAPTRRRRAWSGAMPTRWYASSIHLPENDVDRPQDGGDVRQHVAAAEEIHRLQMRETGRADLAFVRLVGAVGDQVDAELALGRLDGRVYLAGRHVKALGVELEVVDERLHRALHLAARRRHDLVVDDADRSLAVGSAQPLDALLHDAD